MIKRITHIIFFTVFLLAAVDSIGQDFKSDIANMNKFYSEAKSISMKINYRFYSDYTSDVVLDEYNGLYKLQGQNIFSDILGVTSVQDSKTRLAIDKSEQYIQVLRPDTLKRKPMSFNELDKFIEVNKGLSYQGEKGKNKVYRLNLDAKKFACNYIEIFINNEDYHLSKIIFFYNKNNVLYEGDAKFSSPRAEVTYSEVSKNKNIPETYFDIGKYVTKSDGKFKLTKEYQEYQLFNAYRQ